MLLQFKSTKVDSKKAKFQNPSRVRDHLANERTYLAWMRTAIALIGFGIVIVRLRILQSPLPPPGIGWRLGLMFSLVGLVTVLFSTKHYFNSRCNIDEDTYEPAEGLILLFSFAVILLGAGVVYFVFSSTLNAPIALIAD
ncbi:hypothetical protein BCD67_21655 [Oscillatoriales cyanobacterium USR001]|nr:hypothetical protein BCD67_21655 [Oscillatoriales cyanobacterium USR001]